MKRVLRSLFGTKSSKNQSKKPVQLDSNSGKCIFRHSADISLGHNRNSEPVLSIPRSSRVDTKEAKAPCYFSADDRRESCPATNSNWPENHIPTDPLSESSSQIRHVYDNHTRMHNHRVRFESVCESNERWSQDHLFDDDRIEQPVDRPQESIEGEIFDSTLISDLRWKTRLQGRLLAIIDGTHNLKWRTLACVEERSVELTSSCRAFDGVSGGPKILSEGSNIGGQSQPCSDPTDQIYRLRATPNLLDIPTTEPASSRSNRPSMMEFGQSTLAESRPGFPISSRRSRRRFGVYIERINIESRAETPGLSDTPNPRSEFCPATLSINNNLNTLIQSNLSGRAIPGYEVASRHCAPAQPTATIVLLGPNTDFWNTSRSSERRSYSPLSRGNIKRRGMIGISPSWI
ncbi:hypothetical protein BGZ76_008551 [Entomortierella beljakovae]|nr:hypothetical protein BGZ76_008551 [Entomortierella beljakovae]